MSTEQLRTLGTPTLIVPSIAHRRPDVYHAGIGDYMPRSDDSLYRTYKFLGRIAVNETEDHWEAAARAREKFGPSSKVFRTARFWVAYAVH